MGNTYLWSNTEIIKLSEEIQDIIKIRNIKNHIYLLAGSNSFYHGYVERKNNILQLNVVKLKRLQIIDIECSDEHLYLVDIKGNVSRLNEDFSKLKKLVLSEELKCCSHGHSNSTKTAKVRKIAIGSFGILFVTTCGQMWACGKMPQIEIDSKIPKKVTFFEGRTIYDIAVGSDFALALVGEQGKTNDTESDKCEDVLASTCSQCVSSTMLSTPSFHDSFSDLNPCGISVEKSSTSLPNSSNESEGSDSEQNAEMVTSENDMICDEGKEIIIVRDTKGTKKKLTRKVSCPAIMNNKNLMHERVKTVGNKYATLTRNSDSRVIVKPTAFITDSATSTKNEFILSSSQGLSEKEIVEQTLQEKCNVLFKSSSNLLNVNVWTWGEVSHGKIGKGKTIEHNKPILISKLSNVGVIQVHANNLHAAALTLDGRSFLWGRIGDQDPVKCYPKAFELDKGDRVSKVSCGNQHTVILTNSNKLYYLEKLTDCTPDKVTQLKIPINEENSADLELQSICKNIRKSLSSTSMYTCLNINYNTQKKYLQEAIAQEQVFLKELIEFNYALGKIQEIRYPTLLFSKKDEVCQSYNEICYITALNISSLIDYSNWDIPEMEITMLKHAEEHLFIYRKYLKIICDIISLDSFNYIERSPTYIIHQILTQPLERVSSYRTLIRELIYSRNIKSKRLQEIQSEWDCLSEESTTKINEASRTSNFWDNLGKQVNFLRLPHRRLIRESQSSPIYLANVSKRFSSNCFILLSDIFIHITKKSTSIHDLITMWVEPEQNGDNQNIIVLTMPEKTIKLFTTEPEQNGEWLQSLQSAIKARLNMSDLHQPPQTRTASYTFKNLPLYKDATYTGTWLNGQMHRSGTLEWSDGRMYLGQFIKNQMHGYGKHENPTIGIYEGQWKENQQNGKGIMRYVSGDVYKGYFKDGVPHGHGVCKQEPVMSSMESVYVGEWVSGHKQGYGVMDDIETAEKYLGNWLNNKKHGHGLVVTSDGNYYEGVFNQDMLTGHGLMIFEDGTHYEGEFRGAGKFNGKGTLTLSSGDKIEGNLIGSWDEGIKISAGTLHGTKNQTKISTKPKSFAKLCVSGDKKWTAIFQACYQTLGVTEPTDNNSAEAPDKMWQNVRSIISISQEEMLLKGNDKKENQTQSKQIHLIPQFCRKSIDLGEVVKLKLYLQKAFDNLHHPLGNLLSELTEAYQATYSGVGKHPLLLSHAVFELESIIIRIYEIVYLLFPALPFYGKKICLDETDEFNFISSTALLHPILLPHVYSTLFPLYATHNKKNDCIYWNRLLEWNKHTDRTLLEFLIPEKKIVMDSEERSKVFIHAVETLKKLETKFSAFEKLLVIRQMMQNVQTEKSPFGDDCSWSADDLFPVTIFVVVRAGIVQLGSELNFIEDFMEPHLINGQLDYFFTMVKASYNQILMGTNTINN